MIIVSWRQEFIAKRSLQLLFALLLTLAASGYAQAPARVSDNKVYSLSIEAQPLASALSELIVALGIQIVARSDLLEGKTSPGLTGDFSLEGAVKALLSGTALDYNFISEDAIIVFAAENKRGLAEEPMPTPKPEAVGETPVFETVVVTGSRVPRSQFSLPYPTQAIDALYMERGSYTTLADAINSMPLMCEPRYSLTSPSNNGNIGEAFGDLYCLGSQRTLTLVNGRRSISSNEPSVFNAEPGLQVDLNMIPRLMIKNVDVIGVGSAPVYGSDAVAGTINILLKERFEGLEMDLQYSESSFSDGEQVNFGFIAGRDLGLAADGNISIAYEYHDQQGILADQRRYTQLDRDYIRVTEDTDDPLSRNYRFANDVVNPTLTDAGIPLPNENGPPRFALGENGYFISEGRALTFNDEGRLRVFERGEFGDDLLQRNGGDGVRESFYRQLRVPLTRHVFAANGFLSFSPALSVFSELQFYQSQSESFAQIGEVVSTRQNSVYTSLPVEVNLPFIHPDDRKLIENVDFLPDDFYLNKDWRAVIDPRAQSDSQTIRGVFGARGEFSLLQRSWNWELSYSAGRSESDTHKIRINSANFEDVTTDFSFTLGQEIVCASETFCGPFNPLGINHSRAAIDYISQTIVERGETQQSVFTASASAALADMPGGEWVVVAGAEQRREKATFSRSDYDEPRISDNLILPDDFSSDFDTREVFFESVAPVLGDDSVPFIDRLELEANWRGVDHSIAGRDSTWALGSRLYLPVAEGMLQLRANRTQSIRSPALFELSRPLTPVATELKDPCDKDEILLGPNPNARVNNCIEEAAALAFVYSAESFDSLIPDVNPLRLGGTPELDNEQARAYTIGAVYNSGANEGLQLSVDLIDIAIEDAIIERDLNLLASQCYDTGDAASCADIVRDPRLFQIIAITNAYENIGRINLSALQYNLLWQQELGSTGPLAGRLTFNLNAYQLREYREQNRVSSVDRRGFYKFPDWRAYASASYAVKNVEFSWMTHYISEVKIDLPFESDNPPEIGEYFLHHVQLSYQATSALGLRIGVRNVLDSDVPAGLPSKYVGNNYDALGRYYSAAINVSF